MFETIIFISIWIDIAINLWIVANESLKNQKRREYADRCENRREY